MTQTQINVIGFIILGLLFYYVQIYRPKKLRSKPDNVEIRSIPEQLLKLYDIALRNYGEKYYVITQQTVTQLLYSFNLSKNRQLKIRLDALDCDVILVDKTSNFPVLALMLPSGEDALKLDYISAAGLGSIVFSNTVDESSVIKEVNEALNIINADNTTGYIS